MVKVPCSTVTRLELRGQGPHLLRTPHEGSSPDATHKQLLRLMMLTIAGSPLGMKYCLIRTQDRGV